MLTLLLTACAGTLPMNGPFAPCPPSPNCWNSVDPDPAHRTEPLPAGSFSSAVDAALAMARTAVVERTDTYAHITFTSAVWGYVDDVELRDAGTHVDIRSASRVGHVDFGVNEARVSALRAALKP